jgi:hypothetical protein
LLTRKGALAGPARAFADLIKDLLGRRRMEKG